MTRGPEKSSPIRVPIEGRSDEPRPRDPPRPFFEVERLERLAAMVLAIDRNPRPAPETRSRRGSGYPRRVLTDAPPIQPLPPRGLVVGASVWIAVSWLALMGTTPPLQPTSLSYTPAVRMMVQSMLVLTIIAWPLVRLSCSPRPRPVLSALLDTLALLVLWQIVLWPMRLVTTWSVGRLLTVDAEAIASCVLVGAIIAWSTTTNRGRLAGMTVVLLWSIVTPATMAARGLSHAALDGPFLRAWIEAGRGPGPLVPGGWWPSIATAGIGMIIWVVAATRPRTAGSPPVTSVS